MFPDKRFWREGRLKASVARKWNEADGQGRNEALPPVLCREVVVGKPGGQMEFERGQCNGMNRATLDVRYNPAYELNEQIERPVQVRHERGKGAIKREKRMCRGTGEIPTKRSFKPQKSFKT